MEKCFIDYTLIYSQPSVEALENLMADIFGTFGLPYTIDDLFYYGVFFKPNNYANYEFDITEDYDFEIPKVLIDECFNGQAKYDYVEEVINKVLRKEINKPEWMKYIELNMTCDEFDRSPSTFLYLLAKESQYEALAQRLIEFLYSPNLVITMLND